MIVYDLTCEHGHVFESWFGSSTAYDRLVEAGQVSCPTCGSTHISKAPMAPRISRKGSHDRDMDHGMELDADMEMDLPAPAPAGGGDGAAVVAGGARVAEVLEKARVYVEENFEDVGKSFPDEARAIHYGEAEERGIYGEASMEDARDLLEEGIEVLPLPKRRRHDA